MNKNPSVQLHVVFLLSDFLSFPSSPSQLHEVGPLRHQVYMSGGLCSCPACVGGAVRPLCWGPLSRGPTEPRKQWGQHFNVDQHPNGEAGPNTGWVMTLQETRDGSTNGTSESHQKRITFNTKNLRGKRLRSSSFYQCSNSLQLFQNTVTWKLQHSCEEYLHSNFSHVQIQQSSAKFHILTSEEMKKTVS